MKKVLIATALATALVIPAAAQSVGEKTGVNSTLGVAPKTADFVKEAATSDTFELQSSRLAEQRGSPDVKKFAARMIQDHTKTTSELKALVADRKVKAELPKGLDSSHKSIMEKLQTLQTDAFDKQYLSSQVSAHKDAVSLFERYAKGGENSDLKQFAQKNLPTLKEHLQMAQGLTK